MNFATQELSRKENAIPVIGPTITAASLAALLAMAGVSTSLVVSTASAQEVGATPQQPAEGGFGGIDKSGDLVLQAMIETVAGAFIQSEYLDEETGLTVAYNLYIPEGYDGSQSFPLVYFIADSSVVGGDVTAPLTQGYGGLIWASQEEQQKHPSFVLVPQFPQVIIDDHGNYTKTDYVEVAARLVEAVALEYNADLDRLYATGQSMGCMTLMYISAQHPDLFAAELFVSGQWDVGELTPLASQKFFYIAAAGDPKASQGQKDLFAALTAEGADIGAAVWDATWSEAQTAEAVAALVAEQRDINFATFAKGTVLPEGASGEAGGEHMYSFDPAYKIEGVRDWLFAQSR